VFAGLLKRVGGIAAAVALAVPVPAQTVIVPGATIPRVVSTNPANLAQNVSYTLRQITINFDQPMDVATWYWNFPNVATFPVVTSTPYWTNGNQTLIIPVRLAANRQYVIPLNVDQQNFRSAAGIPLQPGQLSFFTGRQGGSSSMATPAGGGTKFTPTSGSGPSGKGGSGIKPGFSSTTSGPTYNPGSFSLKPKVVATPTPTP